MIGFTNTDNSVPYEPWNKRRTKNTTIFGKNTYLKLDQEINDNVLVVGTSGTGKTYSFVEPNLLQANCNYIIADAKGDILRNLGQSLKKQGYKLQILNLVDLKHSMSYNPLANLENDFDVLQFAHSVVRSDVNGNEYMQTNTDPFWVNASENLLLALIFFVREFLPVKEQTMTSVNYIFNTLNQHKSQSVSLSDGLFNWANIKKPDSQAYAFWQKTKVMMTSQKTWGSVLGILGSYLARYSLGEVKPLMQSNQIDFNELLKPKRALFVLYDDADLSKNFISNSFYTQLFGFLYRQARKTGNRLPVKVRMFLDDFKNIQIPHFDDYLATSRSRNISICMMLQNESQLKQKYGINYSSIIGNCAEYLLTGTTDLELAEDASERFNLPIQAIRQLDCNSFLLDVSGHTAKIKRFDYQNHPNYVKQIFDISKNIKTPKLAKKLNDTCLVEIIKNVIYSANLDDLERD